MDANVWEMEAELRTWGERLEKLIANTDWGSTAAKIDYRERMGDLKAKYRTAENKLAELKSAGSSSSETVESGVEDAWRDLETAFQRVAN
jgi:hypothetical protein